MNAIKKAFYHVTAYVPRKLPASPEQYANIKTILMDYYGVKDAPESWRAMSGQIKSTPAHKLRKSYGHLANVAKRITINELAHSDGMEINKALEKRVQEEFTRLAKAYEAENEQKAKEVQPVPNDEQKPQTPAAAQEEAPVLGTA